MQNFTMNCIFNADSTNADGVYVGSFNANYDHGNIYYNMNVIDAGVAVLNMHAPMEIVSKADVYEAYLAYKAFLEK